MKILKGVGQLVNGKVMNQVVEHAEPVTQLMGMAAILNFITGGCGADVSDRAPKLTVVLNPCRLFEAAAHNPWDFPATALELRWWSGQPPVDVLAQRLQVAHHQIGTFKHGRVEPLHHEMTCFTRPFVGHKKGFIHVSRAEGPNRRDLFTGMEAIGDGFQGLGHQ